MFSWAKNILQGWRKLFPIKDCSTKNLAKHSYTVLLLRLVRFLTKQSSIPAVHFYKRCTRVGVIGGNTVNKFDTGEWL